VFTFQLWLCDHIRTLQHCYPERKFALLSNRSGADRRQTWL
jgi:hypothetical protein